MAIDTSLYGRQPQTNPLASILQTVSTIRGFDAQDKQNRLADLQYDEAERKRGFEVGRRNALTESMNPETGALDGAAYTKGLVKLGDYEGLQTYQANQAAQAKALRDAEKADLAAKHEKFKIIGGVIGSAKDQASYTRALGALQQMGIDVSKESPIFDPVTVSQALQMTLDGVQQLEQKWKAADFGLRQNQFGETVRHNGELERNAAGTLAVSQGQLGVSQGNLKVNQDRETREATMPRGQVVQGEQGTVLVDPRTGQGKPVMVDGQPMTAKLKDLPAPIQKAYLENGSALGKIDRALAAVDEYPEAFGSKNMLGDAIRQRTDPKGVNGRALIADIGSLKIHDRSGAAVTAAETPRLKPFIPDVNDTPDTIKKKLALFQKEYQAIQDDIAATYTREQGYKSPAQRVKDAVESGEGDKLRDLKPVSVRTAADYHKLPSGTVYTDPNGTQRTKP